MITRRFRNMIEREIKNDVQLIKTIDLMLKLVYLQYCAVDSMRISERAFHVTVQNAYDALSDSLYTACTYHNVYNDIYERYRMSFRYSDISNLAYDISHELLDEFIDTINEHMLDTNYSFYFERDSDILHAVKTHVICERYRKAIKATYNLHAYVAQYIDFYSNI